MDGGAWGGPGGDRSSPDGAPLPLQIKAKQQQVAEAQEELRKAKADHACSGDSRSKRWVSWGLALLSQGGCGLQFSGVLSSRDFVASESTNRVIRVGGAMAVTQ